MTAASATAHSMSITAQDSNGTGATTGGNLVLTSGYGATPGILCLEVPAAGDFCMYDSTKIGGARDQIISDLSIFFPETPIAGSGGETYFLGFDNSSRTDISNASGRNVYIAAETNINSTAVKGGDITIAAGNGYTNAQAGSLYLQGGNYGPDQITLGPNGVLVGATPADLIDKTEWYGVTTTDTGNHSLDIACATNGEWEIDVDLFASGTSTAGVIRRIYIVSRTSGTISLVDSVSIAEKMAVSTSPLTESAPNNNTLRYTIAAANNTSTKWTLKVHYMTR